jgi:hypothetical protein
LLSPAGDGDALRVYLGEGIGFQAIDARDLVFSIRSSVDIDGDSFDLNVDFRAVDGDALEYLVPVDSGNLVVRADDNGRFVLRSRDGTYACDESFECDRGSRK